MSRPFSPRNSTPTTFVRINGKIRAREVRVIGVEGELLGIIPLGDALTKARNIGVDLVEIAPNAVPPVCRLVDYGKYRYEQAKKEKDSKKHQHINKVKEIQLSPKIDPHDFDVKLSHAINFLCEDMKVKVVLRFKGREMAHQEIGFQRIRDFITKSTPFGTPDSPAKLIGRGINVMISPLPRNKRAKNPNEGELEEMTDNEPDDSDDEEERVEHVPTPPTKASAPKSPNKANKKIATNAAAENGLGFTPFAEIELKTETPAE